MRPYGLVYVGRTYHISLKITFGLPGRGCGWEIVRRLSKWYRPCQLDTEIDESHSRHQNRSQVQATSPRTGQTQSSTQHQVLKHPGGYHLTRRKIGPRLCLLSCVSSWHRTVAAEPAKLLHPTAVSPCFM